MGSVTMDPLQIVPNWSSENHKISISYCCAGPVLFWISWNNFHIKVSSPEISDYFLFHEAQSLWINTICAFGEVWEKDALQNFSNVQGSFLKRNQSPLYPWNSKSLNWFKSENWLQIHESLFLWFQLTLSSHKLEMFC